MRKFITLQTTDTVSEFINTCMYYSYNDIHSLTTSVLLSYIVCVYIVDSRIGYIGGPETRVIDLLANILPNQYLTFLFCLLFYVHVNLNLFVMFLTCFGTFTCTCKCLSISFPFFFSLLSHSLYICI